MLATRISFINEIANLCEKVGADIDQVRQGMGSDDRIGNRFLFPRIGYGGSCFPKDVKALIETGKQNNYRMEICNAVDNVNSNQRINFFKKIESYFKDLRGKKFAFWGLSFKPNTDDIREAPALYNIDELVNEGAKIIAFDPEAMANVKKEIG